MADGYAQATRNAAFVNLHSAAGVGNALGNIYTAHRNQTPMVITAGQQARSILPLHAFLYAERASEFPRPYVKYSVEPARAEDVPAAIARAYHRDAGALRPDLRLGADRRLDPSTDPVGRHTRASAARSAPIRMLMDALVTALANSNAPALVVGPGVDRAQAVDLSRAAWRKAPCAAGAGSVRSRRAAVFPERHPQFAGFQHASPGQLSEALRDHDLVVVIGAPVFTFHVEGHATIFENGNSAGPDHYDATSAAVSPVGTAFSPL